MTLWTVAHQAPLSMGFLRQKYWSGLPFPSPGNLPDPGIKPMSPVFASGFFTTEPPGKPHELSYKSNKETTLKTFRIHRFRQFRPAELTFYC